MSWPSTIVRTKDWGTEVLTDTDLEGQFDLIIAYISAMMHATTGHLHTGGANDGPLVNLSGVSIGVTGTLATTKGGTNLTTYTQGDIIYSSAANTLSKLSAGTAGQALTTGGGGANPAWAGLTTQGDIEYHNGTTRTRLAAGTSGYFLKTLGGGSNPLWAIVKTPYAAGSILLASANTERSYTGATSYSKVKTFILANRAGTLTIKFDAKQAGGNVNSYKFQRNGVDIGSVETEASSTYVTHSQDVAGWTEGDTLDIYYHPQTNSDTAFIKNAQIYASLPTVETATLD